jgi:preprotein translocase subunit SecG
MLSPVDINRGVRRLQIAVYAAALLLLGALLGLNSLITRFGHRGTTETLTFYLASLAVLMAAWFLVLAYASKRLPEHCPARRKVFNGQTAQIVIATKHCGHCGVRVINEEGR